MTDSASPAANLAMTSNTQHNLEMFSHVLYRVAILTLHRGTALPFDIRRRLESFEAHTMSLLIDRAFLDEMRENITRLKVCYNNRALISYHNVYTTCFRVVVLAFKPRKLEGNEKDMRDRLEYRLGTVTLVQRRNNDDNTMVWVLELEEEESKALSNKKGRTTGKIHMEELLLVETYTKAMGMEDTEHDLE